MPFGERLEGVDVAVALVNGLDRTAVSRAELAAACRKALLASAAHGRVGPADAEPLAHLAHELGGVFRALDSGDEASAARQLNEGLHAYDVRPELQPDGAGWQLHHHTAAASRAATWGAGTTIALALVVGAQQSHRLGTCRQTACERVFFDRTRSANQRFCSVQCQDRAKSSTYRARRQRPA